MIKTLPIAKLVISTGYLFYEDLQTKMRWDTIKRRSLFLDQIVNSDCFVFFKSKEDESGALRDTPRQIFSEVEKRGKVIPIYREVSSWGEMTEALSKLNLNKNKIHAIFIDAHGSSNGLSFPKNNGSVESFCRIVNSLGTYPPINLLSCKTADESDGSSSFARTISRGLYSFVIGTDQTTSFSRATFYDREVPTKSGRETIPFGVTFDPKTKPEGRTKIFYMGSLVPVHQIGPIKKNSFSKIDQITHEIVEFIQKVLNEVKRIVMVLIHTFATFGVVPFSRLEITQSK